MEATIEEVIKDINMSLPERKLIQLIERTSLSADVKAIMSDIAHVTIKVGGKVLAIGRKCPSSYKMGQYSGLSFGGSGSFV